MRNVARAITLLLVAHSPVLGCNTCPHDKCASPPSIEIVAKDGVSGAPIPSATVTGTSGGKVVEFPFSCGPNCHAAFAVVPTVVTVSADGYESATLTVTVSEDTCGRTVSEHRDVSLQKTGSTSAPAVAESLGAAACGQ